MIGGYFTHMVSDQHDQAAPRSLIWDRFVCTEDSQITQTMQTGKACINGLYMFFHARIQNVMSEGVQL